MLIVVAFYYNHAMPYIIILPIVGDLSPPKAIEMYSFLVVAPQNHAMPVFSVEVDLSTSPRRMTTWAVRLFVFISCVCVLLLHGIRLTQGCVVVQCREIIGNWMQFAWGVGSKLSLCHLPIEITLSETYKKKVEVKKHDRDIAAPFYSLLNKNDDDGGRRGVFGMLILVIAEV